VFIWSVIAVCANNLPLTTAPVVKAIPFLAKTFPSNTEPTPIST